MEIHIWSDFSCPFCYIGKHNLLTAIKRLPNELQSRIALYYRSFELNVDAPNYTDKSSAEELAERYGSEPAQAKAMMQNATEIAKEFGLTLNYNKSIPTSTLLAHQVQHYVMQNEPAYSDATAERLFKAYFVDGLNLADEATILSLVEEIGLNHNAVAKALEEERYLNQVRDDESIAHQLGIQSVPFFIINQEMVIAGSQTTDEFEQFLRAELGKEGE